uniref:Secreted protein n=1 Tax=Parascaris univalens TaxID=6257 RepID=A0A915ANM4_PARUN
EKYNCIIEKMLQLIFLTALLSNAYAKQLQHSSVERSRDGDILLDMKLQSTMVTNSSSTTNESSHSCPENFKMSISNLPIMYMMGKPTAEYRQGNNQYRKKPNSALKTPTKGYSVAIGLKNALSKEAFRFVHSLQRWINANRLELLVISATMLLITSTIALDCSIYFAAMARSHIKNIEDSLQAFRKDIAATANFKRKLRAAAEKKKNLYLPLAAASLNRNPRVKNKPKVTHEN